MFESTQFLGEIFEFLIRGYPTLIVRRGFFMDFLSFLRLGENDEGKLIACIENWGIDRLLQIKFYN